MAVRRNLDAGAELEEHRDRPVGVVRQPDRAELVRLELRRVEREVDPPASRCETERIVRGHAYLSLMPMTWDVGRDLTTRRGARRGPRRRQARRLLSRSSSCAHLGGGLPR